MRSLRQSFLNGSLTRLLDPDIILRRKIVECVSKGDFGLASGQKPDGSYQRVWFNELVGADEVAFEPGVFLLLKTRAQELKVRPGPEHGREPAPEPEPTPEPSLEPEPSPEPGSEARTFHLSGNVPPEIWNRLGTKLLPKLRSGSDIKIGIDFSVTIDAPLAQSFEADVKQVLDDLGLTGSVRID